ncbi:MAG: hypothetical protein WCL32_19230 [Planctomycetota bacterium]
MHGSVSDTAANRIDKFWALYGAANASDVKVTSPLGDHNDTLLVDGLALSDLYATFGSRQDVAGPPSYSTPFDWNLDGFVDGIDLNQLYTNFGTIWKF